MSEFRDLSLPIEIQLQSASYSISDAAHGQLPTCEAGYGNPSVIDVYWT